MASTAYSEPHLVPVLVLTSFLVLANAARLAADTLLYAGLLGEIAVGVVYGSPLAGLLDPAWEQTFLTLGYLGLLLIVFEGGLSTPLDTLFASLPLAIVTALAGIAGPILLSLALLSGAFSYPLLESFAAGAALSSTSLGTTFTVLRSAGGELNLEKSRIGTVLAAAAVFDDVIGFVLSTVIRSLGEVSNPSDIPPWSVARPLVTSFLYIALAVPFARYILAPSYRRFLHSRLIRSRFRTRIAFVLLIGALSLGVAVTMLIGSSPLLGVYVVGLVLPYLSPTPSLDDRADGRVLEIQPFQEAFDLYLQPVQSYILSPLFFASIGCAIPFLSLWSSTVVWRGIVYAVLMLVAKAACGIWPLVWDRFSKPTLSSTSTPSQGSDERSQLDGPHPASSGYGSIREMSSTAVRPRAPPSSPVRSSLALPPPVQRPTTPSRPAWETAAFLGLAMVARGEVGLLIAQIGYTESGLLSEEGFLVVLWAILLNTVVGPVGVGVLVKRVGARVKDGSWR